jgi:hypothetical protein
VGSAATPIVQLDRSHAAAAHRYDVRVEGLIEATRITKRNPDAHLNGTRKTTVRWTATWENVRVTVAQPTPATLRMSATATGRLRGTFQLADRRPATHCSGATPVDSQAGLVLKAARAAGGPTTFDLRTSAAAEAKPVFCPGKVAELPAETVSNTVKGLHVTASDASQSLRIRRTGQEGALFFPLELLRDGIGFSVSTDTSGRSNKSCGSLCSKVTHTEMRLKFTPSR